MAEKWSGMFKMRQLPKPEYKLHKALKERYDLDDAQELFIVGMRLMLEVERFQDGDGVNWVRHVIDEWRSQKHETREYDS